MESGISADCASTRKEEIALRRFAFLAPSYVQLAGVQNLLPEVSAGRAASSE